MEFGFSDEQEALRKSVREVVADLGGSAAYRRVMASKTGFDEKIWKTIAELGWAGVAIPEELGGLGLGLVEQAIVLEEAGRGVLPAPLQSTVGLAASVLLAADDPGDAGRDALRRIAAGEARATLALCEKEPRWDAAGIKVKAVETDGGWKLSGAKAFVADAHVADEIVVVARTARSRNPEEGISVFLVPRDALRSKPKPQPTLDNTRRLSTVRLAGVEVPAARLVGRANEGWPIVARGLDRAALSIAAETVGVCQGALEMSVAYVKEREQFGKPIGSFQAISHRVADQYLYTENARSSTYYAAWALDEGTPDAPLAVASAKVAAGQAALAVTNSTIQVHGGIGFTWEHDAHLYYRRAKWLELYLGDTPQWRERVASLIA